MHQIYNSSARLSGFLIKGGTCTLMSKLYFSAVGWITLLTKLHKNVKLHYRNSRNAVCIKFIKSTTSKILYLMYWLGCNPKCVRLRWMFMVQENTGNLTWAPNIFWISFLMNVIISGGVSSNFACKWFIEMTSWYFIWSPITVLKSEHYWHFNFFIIIVFNVPNEYTDR